MCIRDSLKTAPVSAGAERGHQTRKDIDRLPSSIRPESAPRANRQVGREIMGVQNREVLIPLVVDDEGAHEERVPTSLRELALAETQSGRRGLQSLCTGPIGSGNQRFQRDDAAYCR